jgi:hypothetical protein
MSSTDLGPVGNGLRQIQWNAGVQLERLFSRFGRRIEKAILDNTEVVQGKRVLTRAGAARAKAEIRAHLIHTLRPGATLIVTQSILETRRLASETQGEP